MSLYFKWIIMLDKTSLYLVTNVSQCGKRVPLAPEWLGLYNFLLSFHFFHNMKNENTFVFLSPQKLYFQSLKIKSIKITMYILSETKKKI